MSNDAPHAGPFFCGVDLGGTKALGVVLDADGSLVAEARAPTPESAFSLGSATPGPHGQAQTERAEEIVECIMGLVSTLTQAIGTPPSPGDDGFALGLGLPGMVDDQGRLRFSPHLPSAAGIDLAVMLAPRLGGVVLVIDNDANCALVAESTTGALKGAQEALMVTLGTGIGGGILVRGRVLRGAEGFAGEVGHMVVDPSGPWCPCGRRGCWERFASGDALGRSAREAAGAGRLAGALELAGGRVEDLRGEHVTAAAAAGDPGALAVMAELGWWVALGLANLTAVLDPPVIAIGGGLAAAGDCLFEPTRKAFRELLEGSAVRRVASLVPAALGERAGAVGAALIARGASAKAT